jgi:hypothetical protein
MLSFCRKSNDEDNGVIRNDFEVWTVKMSFVQAKPWPDDIECIKIPDQTHSYWDLVINDRATVRACGGREQTVS